MSGRLDSRGCLTDEGVAELARAPLGQVPAEVAAHLAGCARCQDRLLQAGREPGESRPVPSGRKPFRNLTLVGVLLLFTLALLGVTLSLLSGR